MNLITRKRSYSKEIGLTSTGSLFKIVVKSLNCTNADCFNSTEDGAKALQRHETIRQDDLLGRLRPRVFKLRRPPFHDTILPHTVAKLVLGSHQTACGVFDNSGSGLPHLSASNLKPTLWDAG